MPVFWCNWVLKPSEEEFKEHNWPEGAASGDLGDVLMQAWG